MITNSQTTKKLPLITKEKQFQKTGANKTSTGELMSIQQFTDFTNTDLFQLATLLDARLTQWLTHQTMPEPPQTGDTLMSTGKLMLLHPLERETCQT